MLNANLYIGHVKDKGRGVFTRKKIPVDTIIEVAPVIVMTKKDQLLLDQTLLHDYIFLWGQEQEQCCMALGYVPIYNHSYASNCEYFMDYEDATIMVKTVRMVQAGEELTINYNGNWNDDKKVWFEVNDV